MNHWLVEKSGALSELVGAASAQVNAGSLTFYDATGRLVRAFAPGRWATVIYQVTP